MHVGTWNLAGIAEDQIDFFISQLSDNYPWIFILLQEAFSRTEGIEFDGRHVVVVPAILVHEEWAPSVKEVSQKCVLVSMHLPHVGRGLHEFISCLHSLDVFLSSIDLPIYVGMDSNTRVHSAVDHVHVGDSVPMSTFGLVMCERASILHNFLCKYSLYLANTFMDKTVMTRVAWGGCNESQIDFLAAPLKSRCVSAGVDQSMVVNSDHRMVWACFSQELPRVLEKRVITLRNWQPGSSWETVSAALSWDWHDWNSTTCAWREAAVSCARRAPKPRDDVLTNLLRDHANASVLDRRRLNKLIWRRRRVLKRQKAKDALRVAAQRGSLLASQPKALLLIGQSSVMEVTLNLYCMLIFRIFILWVSQTYCVNNRRNRTGLMNGCVADLLDSLIRLT